MYSYGKSSRAKLDTCDPRLVEIYDEAIKVMDLKIFCGERGEEEQNKAYNSKRSKVKYPNSKHNTTPEKPLSRAVDAGPYPVSWDTDRELFLNIQEALKDGRIDSVEKAKIDRAFNSLKRWYAYGATINAIAIQLGYKIRWGGDWDGDWDFTDQNFDDLPHIEIVGD